MNGERVIDQYSITYNIEYISCYLSESAGIGRLQELQKYIQILYTWFKYWINSWLAYIG